MVTIKDIKKGDKFSKINIATKRPSPKINEIPANKYFKILNKTAKKFIPNNTKLKFKDVL